eukprot:TRINITY_DN11321_c0_g1_i1.p1 TRINITY_DN11321_c0_g1~~TRINITY_DN11321_c0_g1_i1.p1  ORF type:complete len:296 (+),score=15.22 TRINITY_DN11321_c0_g1_i1:292-1179(+)
MRHYYQNKRYQQFLVPIIRLQVCLRETSRQRHVNFKNKSFQYYLKYKGEDGTPFKSSKTLSPVQVHPPKFSHLTFEQIRASLQQFAEDRDWSQFHTPRNLLLALMGEVGELSEEFQWRGEVQVGLPGLSADEKRAVADEVADVLLYLVRFADVCGIDLATAATNKLKKNEVKYPSHLCRGSSAKYTAYNTPQTKQQQQSPRQQAHTVPKAMHKSADNGSPSFQGQKRKRFTEEQVQQMNALASKVNWSINALTQEERDCFCQKWSIPQVKLQNFFNNRKPKGLKRTYKMVDCNGF